MTNKSLLLIIAILLLGICSILVIDILNETPAEEFASSLTEISEEIGDEIDDNT